MPPRRQPPPVQKPSNPPADANETSSEQPIAGASNDATPVASGSTPMPAPPKRLDSITGAASASTPGRKPAVAAPKFSGRRSQAARAELEQAEAKKKAAEARQKAAEAAKDAREARRYGYGRGNDRGGRGGGRGGRGRGGHMGDSQRQKDEGVASGPFSSGHVLSDSGKRTGWGPGGGGGGGGPSHGGGFGGGGRGPFSGNIKSEGGGAHASMGAPGAGGFYSSDEEDGDQSGPRQDVDRMQVIDLTNEEDSQSQDPLSSMAPVRLTRVPHKDRTVGLKTEEGDESDNQDATPTERKKGKQKVKDVEVTGSTQKQRRPTAYSSSDTESEVQIKQEPTDGDATMGEGEPAVDVTGDATLPIQSPPTSPGSKRKVKENAKATGDSAIVEDSDDDFPMPEEPKFQTQAEKDEWQRKYLDLRILRDELGALMPQTPKPAQPDAEGDTRMEEEPPVSARVLNKQKIREDHVYLFQFPPVLPQLEPVAIKSDVENPPDTQAIDIDQDTSAKDAQQPQVKQEEAAPGPLHFPSGSVGKLRIHKSGKATLDWGGTSLSLGMGADATFLQNIMIAKLPEKKPQDQGGDATAAAQEEQESVVGLGMGTVRGKFVLTPNWDEILR